MFFKIYPEKIWGISTDDMTPDWAPKRIEFRQKVTPFYHNQRNAVGKYGTGCIYERIRDKFLDLGGRLHLGAEVRNIVPDGKVLKKIEFADGNTVLLAGSDVVISSLPITLTARFFGHQSKLSFRGICSIYLAYRRSEILPKDIHWLYYGSERMYFNRITEPKKLSPFVAPADQTYLTVKITYSRGDEIDAMDPEELMRQVAEQVDAVGLASKEELIDSSLDKEDFVYPLQYTGYQEELVPNRAVLLQYQQLYSIGTGGDFNYADSQIHFHKAFDTVFMLCNQDSSYTQVERQTSRCDLNRRLETIRQEGNPDRVLLQCNSSYPAAPEKMNLNAISALKHSLHVPVGLSDHTFGLYSTMITNLAIMVAGGVTARRVKQVIEVV